MSAGARKRRSSRSLSTSESEKKGPAPALLEVKAELCRKSALAHARDYPVRRDHACAPRTGKSPGLRLQASL